MRSPDAEQPSLFSTAQTGDFVPDDHPLRRIRSLVDSALDSMQGTLTVSYSHTGRPSIPPERLIRAILLQVLFSIRSERQLVEHLRYNMLYRWFVGLSLDDAVWSATSFTKNRERFVDYQMTGRLLDAVVEQARRRQLLSEQHFCVDGTLIDAWASMGSYRRIDDDDEPPSGPPDFKDQPRRSDTHECKTDPDARLYKKAKGQPSSASSKARARRGLRRTSPRTPTDDDHELIAAPRGMSVMRNPSTPGIGLKRRLAGASLTDHCARRCCGDSTASPPRPSWCLPATTGCASRHWRPRERVPRPDCV